MYHPTHYNPIHFFFNDTTTTEIYTLSLHDALPISHREGHIGQGVRPDFVILVHDGRDVPDLEPLIGGIDPPARTDMMALGKREHARVQRVRRSRHDLVEGDTVLLQQVRHDVHVQHLQPLAPDGDIGHTAYAQQALSDGPIGDHRQVDHGPGL